MTSRPVSRIGAIGDVHCENERLHNVLAFFSSNDVDTIVCVGDVVDGPGSLDACCALLQQHEVMVVRGNHERWLLANDMRDLRDATPLASVSAELRRYLAAYPVTMDFDTLQGPLLLCHGLGDDDMASVGEYETGYALDTNQALQALLRQATYRYVVCGHTHRHMVRRFAGLIVINAGTLSREHDPCCAILDFERGEASFHDLDAAGEVVPHRRVSSIL